MPAFPKAGRQADRSDSFQVRADHNSSGISTEPASCFSAPCFSRQWRPAASFSLLLRRYRQRIRDGGGEVARKAASPCWRIAKTVCLCPHLLHQPLPRALHQSRKKSAVSLRRGPRHGLLVHSWEQHHPDLDLWRGGDWKQDLFSGVVASVPSVSHACCRQTSAKLAAGATIIAR